MTHHSPLHIRPVIDLDLGRAHQYGYRRPYTNPTRIGEQPELPAEQTRNPAEEPTCGDRPTD